MSDTSLVALRRLLLHRYGELKSRLARHLGSSELAGEALQDTWLRLQRGEGIAAVHSHDAYLFRIAVNLARDRQRAEDRRLTTNEIEGLLTVVDDTPDSEQIVAARSDLRALEAVMAELPPRQREILLAARLDGLPRDELARRFRISVRLIQRELQEAQDYCAARIKRKNPFTPGARKTSPQENPSGAGAGEPIAPDTDE
jgi:RNA polymerase sigma-70 factor (ECF subfamily)